MRRIAVIADIHANIHALEAFMNYIDNECDVTQVLNLGDFIQIGPNPAEVYDIVMNDSRFVNIMGNSECMFFDNEVLKHYVNESAHQEWMINQLGDERMNGLKKVPFSRIIEVENKKLLMIHSRLNSAVEQPLLYSDKTLGEFIADYDENVDYVLIGHTHLPLYAVHWNNKPIINPGSIGCGKDGIIRFVMMEFDKGVVDIIYKQIPYDKEKVISDYNKKGVPCSEKFIAMFY